MWAYADESFTILTLKMAGRTCPELRVIKMGLIIIIINNPLRLHDKNYVLTSLLCNTIIFMFIMLGYCNIVFLAIEMMYCRVR